MSELQFLALQHRECLLDCTLYNAFTLFICFILFVLLLSESNACPSNEVNSKYEVVNLNITKNVT